MKTLALYLVNFTEANYVALEEILRSTSIRFAFDYHIVDDLFKADIIFLEENPPKDFPKNLESPQLILTSGATFYACKTNQHRITWGSLEKHIGLIINIIEHFTTLEEYQN